MEIAGVVVVAAGSVFFLALIGWAWWNFLFGKSPDQGWTSWEDGDEENDGGGD